MFINGSLERTYDEEVGKVLKTAYKYIKKLKKMRGLLVSPLL
ncbi:hypothetical protein EVA_19079 [gut metagenome]|uniref:Uncharacterized protein n=1 Tax=gut metagenome TaxID=749906 RepID=J9FZN1_9ZZZZ